MAQHIAVERAAGGWVGGGGEALSPETLKTVG